MPEVLRSFLLVGCGSFFGGGLRFLVSALMKPVAGKFPVGTLTVNLIGCLLIGLFYGIAARYTAVSKEWILLLTAGFCGGFTTFSAFANESLLMAQGHNWLGLGLYVGVSVVAGVLLVLAGYQLVKLF